MRRLRCFAKGRAASQRLPHGSCCQVPGTTCPVVAWLRGCCVPAPPACLALPCRLALQSSRSAPCLRHHHLNQASSSHLCRPTIDQSWPANSLTLHDPSTLPDPVGSLFPVFACSSAGVVGSPALPCRALVPCLGKQAWLSTTRPCHVSRPPSPSPWCLFWEDGLV